MQVSTDRDQDYLVKLVAAGLCLSCDQAIDHFPYCPNNTGPHAPQSAVRHSHIPFPPLPINMKCPSWFVLLLKSNSTNILTRSPSRRMVTGSAYTVVPDSLEPSDIHSAYAGSLLSISSTIPRTLLITSAAKPNRSRVLSPLSARFNAMPRRLQITRWGVS